MGSHGCDKHLARHTPVLWCDVPRTRHTAVLGFHRRGKPIPHQSDYSQPCTPLPCPPRHSPSLASTQAKATDLEGAFTSLQTSFVQQRSVLYQEKGELQSQLQAAQQDLQTAEAAAGELRSDAEAARAHVEALYTAVASAEPPAWHGTVTAPQAAGRPCFVWRGLGFG